MNHNNKILKIANKCTILYKLKINDVDFCVKDRLLNAILNRWESNYTQYDVAEYLNVSKRTVVNIEKLEVNNIIYIFNYINLFGNNNALNKKKESYKKLLK